MRASSAAENLLQKGLDELGCPVNSFAVIYNGRSASYISQSLTGLRNLGGPESQAMLQLIAELKKLRDDVAPLPIDFRQAQTLREILEDRREKAAATEAVAK